MPAVIENRVERAQLVDHRPEESNIGLVTDTHVDAMLGIIVPRGLGIDIQTHDGRVRQILSPHLQRATPVHPDLQHPLGPREGMLINGQVMTQLVHLLGALEDPAYRSIHGRSVVSGHQDFPC
ncbi:Uncharacterised protein [Mycobacteroides abscessus subsp. abscessus]|nr:Uncharacterised protein [Mycobacteroides abscessus subsp. abscessus]SIL60668.1 Uncharacterised protein [Mycobacteroides abscessus subsp. abscessus]SKP82904.1 Uncharacterised protein [Mycobacteroides abscessus subsp. abscessus]